MRSALDVCGCFPTGRHYAGIADRLAQTVTKVEGLAAGHEAGERWSAAKLAIIDFETTGLHGETDRIIEIGVATFENGKLSGLKNWMVNPGIPVSDEIIKLTKIDPADLVAAAPFKSLVDEFRSAVEGHLPVAYNAPFDTGFLQGELKRLGGPGAEAPPAFDPAVTWIDPLVWVRELQKGERGMKLVDVCARLGITLDNAHRAASDAEATGRVLLAIADQMPATYGELIRLQGLYAGRQDVDHAAMWRRRS